MSIVETPVFLLHGLGERPWTLILLSQYLNWCGFKNVHRPHYPVNKLSLDESLDYLDTFMQYYTSKGNPVILIGVSMGGVLANNLHHKGWQVEKAIYVGSPLNGAKLMRQIESTLPATFVTPFLQNGHEYLRTPQHAEEPPHPFHTISMGWGFSEFDGSVYREDAVLDERRHTHVAWTIHNSISFDPRLFMLVHKLLTE